MSHHMGATFSTPCDQMMESVPIMNAKVVIQKAKKQAPTFQVRSIELDNEESTSIHAMKLAIGTSGYDRSILSLWNRNVGRCAVHGIYLPRTSMCAEFSSVFLSFRSLGIGSESSRDKYHRQGLQPPEV